MATVISIVSYPFLPALNGGQKSVALFNSYFSRYQPLICVTTKKNRITGNEGYEIIGLFGDSRLRYLNPLYFFPLRRIVKEKKATHLLIEHPYYGWLALLIKWACGVKLIVRSQNIEARRGRALGKGWWWMLAVYEKFIHRQADYNFFITYEDKRYAIERFGLAPLKCLTVTYGIDWDKAPSGTDCGQAKAFLQARYQIDPGVSILLFTGDFAYPPNLEGLERIIAVIDRNLQQQKDFRYRILICGMNIPPEIAAAVPAQIRIAGFVEDVRPYFLGADVFINPVTAG